MHCLKCQRHFLNARKFPVSALFGSDLRDLTAGSRCYTGTETLALNLQGKATHCFFRLLSGLENAGEATVCKNNKQASRQQLLKSGLTLRLISTFWLQKILHTSALPSNSCNIPGIMAGNTLLMAKSSNSRRHFTCRYDPVLSLHSWQILVPVTDYFL